MNKSILLIVLPCILAIVVVNAAVYQTGHNTGYPQYYYNQLNAYKQQTGLYRAGNAATAQLRSARLLNYCKF
jgi:hypothetical protein